MLVLTLDLIGTFVFAISGAASGVKARLDVFGVSVLAFVAGNAGGITRDVLIGAVPPAAINDWRYLAASLIAGLTTFLCYPSVTRGGARDLCRLRHAKGTRLRCQPRRRRAARHADGNWRRDGA